MYEATSYEGDPRESEEMRPRWFSVAELPLKVREGFSFYSVPHTAVRTCFVEMICLVSSDTVSCDHFDREGLPGFGDPASRATRALLMSHSPCDAWSPDQPLVADNSLLLNRRGTQSQSRRGRFCRCKCSVNRSTFHPPTTTPNPEISLLSPS